MKKINLSDVCEISAGQSAPQKAEYFSEDGYPFVRAGSLEKLIAGNDELEHINDTIGKKLRLRLFPQNTILFAKSGMSAKIGRVFKLQSPSYVVSHLAAIIPDLDKIEPNWLKIWFEFNPPSRLIPNDAYPSIKLSEIARLKIPVIALEKQKQVSTVLNVADSLRQKRKEQLKLLDDYLKSVFIKMFGDPVAKNNGWEKISVGICVDILSGFPFKSVAYTSDSSQTKLCGGLIIYPNEIDWEKANYWPNEKLDGMKQYYLQLNDIVMALDRPWISLGFKMAMVKARDLPSLLVQRTARIRAHKLNQYYLFFLLQHQAFKMHCKVTETTVPHISTNDIKTHQIMNPPLELQNKFASIVEQVEQTKQKMRASLDEMDNHFNALMQRYFG